MGRFQGAAGRSVKWMLLVAGLLSTSCAGAIGAGAAVVFVGAGVLAYTCYDRVSVTVTDRLTGTKLCDAKVTFLQGSSETKAESCYDAALSAGKYVLRVERPGLETFEEPVEVTKGGHCGQTVQTMFVALDRKNRVQPPQQIGPRAVPVFVPPAVTAPSGAPAGVTAPPVAPPPGAVPAPPAASSSATAPLPPAPPPPASTSFPDAP